VDAGRERFRQELETLSARTAAGSLYRGTVDGQTYFLGAKPGTNEGAFVLQADADDAEPMAVESSMLDAERNHPALHLVSPAASPASLQDVELAAADNEIELSGSFGTARFHPVTNRRVLQSGRVVTNEVAEFIDRLRKNNVGLYLSMDSQFTGITSAPHPEQSAGSAFGSRLLSIGTLGLGSVPSTTLHIPASAPVTSLDRTKTIYILRAPGRYALLPLTKNKSDYTFTAVRANYSYVPREADYVSGTPLKLLDDGIYTISLSDVKQGGVYAVVQQDGATYTYYLVQIEP
jgi:hypothetical protein